jgi:hypothetical protein
MPDPDQLPSPAEEGIAIDAPLPPPQASSTLIADTLRWVSGMFDTGAWPDGAVRGVLVLTILIVTILGFWRGKQWNLPDVLAQLLPVAWGYVASLPTRSSLKAWVVLLMWANLAAMMLVLDWSPPTLTTLAIAGISQYVIGRRDGETA